MDQIIFADGTIWLGRGDDARGVLVTPNGYCNYDLGYVWVNMEGESC